jgi:adenosylcobinamide-phosphate synthase
LEPITQYILISAVILDILIGDPRWFPHPVLFIGKLISFLERVLRSLLGNEMLGGALLLVLTVGISCGLAAAILKLAYAVNSYLGLAIAVFISWSCLAARSLHRESRLVADALARGDLSSARKYLSYIVGRDTAELDEPEVWRATVETVAENTSDGVIAPLFYLCLGGPVLAIAYKAVNTLDSMVGYRNERYIEFGQASARFDDFANFVPARITGLLMVAVAPLLGLSAKDSWRIMRRDGRNHTSPNSGIPEAAVAGALGIRLGGTNLYGGRPVAKPDIGDAVHNISRASWHGAVRLMYGAEALLLTVWLLITGILVL